MRNETNLFHFQNQLVELMKHSLNRILVADDEEFCQASMKAILHKSGVDIYNKLDICMNGIEMLDLVKSAYTNGSTYKLIFCDFSMPGMDGIEAVF